MFRQGMTTAIVALALGLAPLLAGSQTIGPGEVRAVTGTIAALDVANRTVVVDAPLLAGDVTVGVTLGPGVEPRLGGKDIGLADVAVGDRAVLRYTRENGRLVGLGLTIHR